MDTGKKIAIAVITAVLCQSLFGAIYVSYIAGRFEERVDQNFTTVYARIDTERQIADERAKNYATLLNLAEVEVVTRLNMQGLGSAIERIQWLEKENRKSGNQQ